MKHLGATAASLAAFFAIATSSRADIPVTARGDRVTAAPARRSVRTGYERWRLAQRIPANPYSRTHASATLPGFVNTAPLVLDDGAIVVGLASPPGIAWIEPDGTLRTSTRLDERPSGDLAVGADGRVFATSERSSFFTIAPDGTVRATMTGTGFLSGPIVRDDGTVVLVENTGTNSSVLFVSPTGERVGSVPVSARVNAATLGADGCVWLVASAGLFCIDRDGRRRDPPFGRGANLVVPVSPQVIGVQLASELQLRAPDGALHGRLSLTSPLQWHVPLASGGLAILRLNPSQELQILGPDAAIVGRAAFNLGLGVRVLAPLTDEDGAFIVASSEGLILALEPDGSERWRMDTRRRFARGPVPLPHGGFVIPLAEGGLFFVEP